MSHPVIVEAVRTPIGRRDGALSGVHAASLLGHVQKAVLARTGVEPSSIDQVIGGCVTQVGEQSFNIARTAWLAAGMPFQVGAATIDCQCGSSQQANHLAHNLIAAGVADAVIACGVEAMSRVAIGANMRNGPGTVKPEPFPYDLPDRFVAGERIARKHGLTRPELDAFGLTSNQRALQAAAEGRFGREITPIEIAAPPTSDGEPRTRLFCRDEAPRSTSLERMAALKTHLPDGIHTAATICQVADGASAVLWMDERRAHSAGLRPRARLRAQVLVGTDPYFHVEGPVDATAGVLRQAGMTIDDIDLFEINEAFAAVVLGWARSFGADLTKVNVNGGAIALGHPMGATGCRLITTALHELERSDRSVALIAMCCGGAVATGSILERI